MSILMIIIGSIILAVGIYLLYFIDRDIGESDMYKVVFGGLALVALGIFGIFYTVPAEVIRNKFIGLVIAIIGFWFTFKFPGASEIQGEGYGVTGIFFGIIMLILGLMLLIL